MERKYKYLSFAVLIVILVVFVFGILPRLSLLHGEMEIDLHTGRCLIRNYICNLKISENITETPLSKLLNGTQQEKTPLWKLESEWSDFPMKYSKGGELRAICDSFVNLLEIGVLNNKIDNEQKKKCISQFLSHLEKADIQKVKEYHEEVASIVMEE